MKKFWVVFLVFFIPLQAVLWAVQPCHGHDAEHESTIDALIHPHDEQIHYAKHYSVDNNQQDQGCEGDHHHCHAHHVSVLPNPLIFVTLPDGLEQAPELLDGFQSFSSNRIERPKWV